MYCPKCGHQAVSNNVRYCPGCGFWLHSVAELVANDGVFAAEEEKSPKPRRSMAKRGALLGATLMFIVPLLIILAVFHDPTSGDVGDVLSGNFVIWLALMAIISLSGYLKRLITSVFNIFSEEEPSHLKKIVSSRIPALPAPQTTPVADSGQQFIDTPKMGHPSSVVEQTTSRLNKA